MALFRPKYSIFDHIFVPLMGKLHPKDTPFEIIDADSKIKKWNEMNHSTGKPTRYVRQAKTQISLRVRAV